MILQNNNISCKGCSYINPTGAKFCNECGTRLEQPTLGQPHYGIFYAGGYGDGYCTSFGFKQTPEEMLRWQNSPASLSINHPNNDQFLAEITEMDLLPEDKDKGSYICSRSKVLRWWKLIWNGQLWEIGEELKEHPESLGLSNFE